MDETEFGQTLESRLLMVLDVDVAPPLDLGLIGGVGERVVALTGGRVSGPYRGRIVPGGSDWQAVKPDGTLEIRARYVAELEEGLVEIISEGLRAAEPAVQARIMAGEIAPPTDYYFRTAMRFRTSAPALDRLNSVLAIAVGTRLPTSVNLRVFEIL
jgi:hypothetical protein